MSAVFPALMSFLILVDYGPVHIKASIGRTVGFQLLVD